MEFDLIIDGDTRNYWRYKKDRIGNESFANVYVSKEDHPTRPTSVRIVVE